jgi:hypothetical protein
MSPLRPANGKRKSIINDRCPNVPFHGQMRMPPTLVGPGATAQPTDSDTILFQIGLTVAVLAAALAAWAFLPRAVRC